MRSSASGVYLRFQAEGKQQMRVISGKYRGLNLVPFKGEEIRPTADRVKESLFNILSFRVAGATVADVFCGSGNLGIECLSRGAAKVYFNDCAKSSLLVLEKNLSKLKDGHDYSITCMDFLSFLRSVSCKFDIIFLDPPYRFDYGVSALKTISERGLLSDGGVAVYERDRQFADSVEGLDILDERKYGKTWLTFFGKGDSK